MLPKLKRFKEEDFIGTRPKVFFRGTVFDCAKILLPSQKFACVIAKKTIKRAVDRNRIKRRIFNTIRNISIDSTDSFIFYPKKGSQEVPQKILNEEINQAFATLHSLEDRR